jgi:hypothetical protein
MTAGSVVQKSGQVKPRLHGIKALFTHQVFRRLVQFSFAAFIAYITVVHVVAGESSSVITASPEAYCPFGGLETFYKYVVSGGTFVPHTHLSNLVVAVAALLTALLLRALEFLRLDLPTGIHPGYCSHVQRMDAEAFRPRAEVLPHDCPARTAGLVHPR